MQQASPPRNNFLYHISVSGDQAGEPSRKRKLREDYHMSVAVTWDVTRTCYCSDDRTLPIVDLDSRTATFDDLEYRVFTMIDDDDIGVVDKMITCIGRLIKFYDGVSFDEINEMVHRIRRVVDEAYRSGRPRMEKLNVIVTLKNETGLTLEDYEKKNYI